VAFGGGSFVAVGDRTILASTDGINWSTNGINVAGAPNAIDLGLQGVTYGDGQFVAVGSERDGGVILTSTDGISWLGQSAGGTNGLWAVAYGNGLFVTISDGTVSLTSPDGMVWTEHEFNWWNEFGAELAYGNGVFVALADDGVILTSTDGADWATNSSGTFADFYAITCGGGTFVAAGTGGLVLTSTNGTNWVIHNSGTMNELFGAGYGQNTFFLVGEGGEILQSGVVPPPGPPLSPVPGWTNGVFSLNLSAPLGGQWELQASTDLLNWTSLGTITITNIPMPFVDTGARNFQQRFYRAVSQ
jgi:hypothetical protein